MISEITIAGFRGIRQGTVSGMRDLTVLTGTNGCGKSAVLDALLLVGSDDTARATATIITRHPVVPATTTWLMHQGAKAATDAHCIADGRKATLSWEAGPRGRRPLRVSVSPFTLMFDSDGTITGRAQDSSGVGGTPVWLIDPGIALPLVDDWSEVTRDGDRTKQRMNNALKNIVPDAVGLDLAVERGSVELRVTYADRAVPVALAGDGVQAAVQLMILLARVPDDGLALIEEPEVYQHPSTLHQTARVIVDTVLRGVQVVLTTHSIELIDGLCAAMTDIERMSVIRLRLTDGELASSVFAGEQIKVAREDGFQDLR